MVAAPHRLQPTAKSKFLLVSAQFFRLDLRTCLTFLLAPVDLVSQVIRIRGEIQFLYFLFNYINPYT